MIGGFQVGPFQTNYQQQAPTPPVVVVSDESRLGGTKARRKKIRGPYSDPRIFEAYIKRCIAEREAPRVNVEVAVLKEALVEAVEQRPDDAEFVALARENTILKRLVAVETTKRDFQALQARQRQIEQQLEELEDEEMRNILMLFIEL